MIQHFQTNEAIRAAVATGGGWLWMTAGPAVPYGVVCSLMVLADVVTARRLARRLRRRVKDEAGLRRLRFSSARLGRSVMTLGRIYMVLVLASMVDTVVAGATGAVLKLAAGCICFWQAVSILENEAACNGAPWAAILRRVLIDKAERYLGVSLSDIDRN